MYKFGFVPPQFGEAYITPVPKDPNEEGIDNCRPIFILCVIRKLLDIYMLKSNKFPVPKNQFGFQPNTDIHDALMHVQTQYMNRSKKDTLCSYFLLCDISKAYDALDRNSLMYLFDIINRFVARLILCLVIIAINI